MVWGAIIGFGIVFPLALPRKINSLRHASIFGVCCAFYLVFAVFIIFLTDKDLVPDPVQNLSDIKLFNVSSYGVFSSIPLITFACIYQQNLPMLYNELRYKNLPRINRVIMRGLSVTVIAYVFTGIFGYATFVNNPAALESENILEAPYGKNVVIYIAQIC
jgi:amino acid permease